MRGAALAVFVATAAGCCCGWGNGPWWSRRPHLEAPTFSRYQLENWDWSRVQRVLVLPFLNESEYTHAGDEAQAALAGELQRMGRFEVVSAASDDRAALAAQVHRGGRFDELAMLEIARQTKADVVVHGIVTHYSPYPRPRLGLIVQAVSPALGKVVASVDGLWDTTDTALADRCRTYYRQRPRPRPPWLRNNVIVNDDSFAEELALDSPALFQRWVCHEAALTLLGQAVPGVLMPEQNVLTPTTTGEPTAMPANCSAPRTATPGANVK
ncbi:MAG: hypothetical protein RMJ56_17625 [Gemmataceae bacterium]|nr:hypothetical protein [Gemmata sp.]MDW8199418.1 hypothetical protein [Gemmataceae bacterium]